MNAIITDLETLVPSVLKCVLATNLSKDPTQLDYPGFPTAVVLPPVLKTADYEDTATNLRSYEWYVLVLANPEDIPKSDPTYLAGLEDNVCAVFDTDCTLQGTAPAGVFPAVLPQPAVNIKGITYTAFYIQFTARVLVPASVSQN
jgi:hypothetical protein